MTGEHAQGRGGTRMERVKRELHEFLVLSGYLCICFIAVSLYKAAILQSLSIAFAPLAFAIGKALVSAKFILMGMMLGIGRHRPGAVPGWQALVATLLSVLVLIAMTALEEIALGYLRGEGARHALASLGGGTAYQFAATALLLLVLLYPYFALRALGAMRGEESLLRLLFSRAPAERP